MKAESSTNSRAAARRAAHAATSLTPMPPEEIWKGMAKYMIVCKWRVEVEKDHAEQGAEIKSITEQSE